MFEPRCPRCGAGLRTVPVTEDAPLDPRNAYAVSKSAQEQMAAVWAGLTGGSAVALRYHSVYGPRMPRDTPYPGVAAIFRSALEAGLTPRVFEDGAALVIRGLSDSIVGMQITELASTPLVCPGGGTVCITL